MSNEDLVRRLDRLEEVVLGLASGLAVGSGSMVVRPIHDQLEEIRAEVRERCDG